MYDLPANTPFSCMDHLNAAKDKIERAFNTHMRGLVFELDHLEGAYCACNDKRLCNSGNEFFPRLAFSGASSRFDLGYIAWLLSAYVLLSIQYII